MNEHRLQEAILRAGPRLALGMMHKLSVHISKGPWEHKSIGDLVEHLDSEVAELKEALRDRQPYPRILDECADIANMAMIIADHVHQIGEALPLDKADKRCDYRDWTNRRCTRAFNHGDGHAFSA